MLGVPSQDSSCPYGMCCKMSTQLEHIRLQRKGLAWKRSLGSSIQLDTANNLPSRSESIKRSNMQFLLFYLGT